MVKKKNDWLGPVLMVAGFLTTLGGFIKYASDNPEGAGRFLGAYEKARKPRTKVVTKHEGLFSTYTTVRYE